MSIIALDLGTTFIKGAVLDLDNLSLHHIQRLPFPEPLPNLPPLFYEVDPGQLVATVRTLISDLLQHAPDCEGVVMCTQMHGLVLCQPDGQPMSNVITWQDQRVLTQHPSGAGTYFEQLTRLVSAQEQQQLGNELQPSRPLCYLYWMAENNLLPKTTAIPAGIPDFVIANLSSTIATVEATSAGAHCAFNLETMNWHYPVIERLGLAHLNWPRVRAFGEAAGTAIFDGKSLPMYTPVGDHQCALVGSFLGGDELSLNISTGSQVSLLTNALTLGNYQTRPFFGRFLNTITGVPAGRSLNHLVNLLTELARAEGVTLADPWRYITETASTIAETDLNVNLAFFDSAGGKNGYITNIREENLSVGHLFRAAFQNMADNYYTNALRIAPHQPWRQIVFSGGLAQKIEMLRTLIQRKFQTHYRLCASSEDTLLGLLALALVATGRQPSVEAAMQMLLTSYAEGEHGDA
ncbi:MAG: FGGY family carbohydrate kinase [Caldilineaceae bacterium]